MRTHVCAHTRAYTHKYTHAPAHTHARTYLHVPLEVAPPLGQVAALVTLQVSAVLIDTEPLRVIRVTLLISAILPSRPLVRPLQRRDQRLRTARNRCHTA